MIAAARWTAIAIAAAAVLDPRVPVPRSERPVVRVVSTDAQDATPIASALTQAGFAVDAARPEAATVLVGSEMRGSIPAAAAGRTTLWALDTSPPAPNVAIARASVPDVRLPGQAAEVRVEVRGNGVTGQTTELVLEHAGIPVAAAQHQWTAGEPRWTATLRYLPPNVSAASLRVRASTAAGESRADDNAADVAVPAARGPIRVLMVEASVTWPAVFVRRALEGEPSIAVSSLQRAARTVATRAGDPPAVLTRATLARFETVVIGGPDQLRPADLDALRWFVERRGGVAVFVPDRPPAGRYLDLVGVSAFTSRALDAAAPLGGAALHASELAIPVELPPAAAVLASADKAPVVFAARRGAGAIVFSGALDAWRQRGEGFTEFWRGLLLANAATVPAALDVSVEPAIVRPGERTAVVARVRDIPEGQAISLPPLTARAVSPDARVDEPIRLWPTSEPGVYEGEWRARGAGAYGVTVSSGDARGDAAVTVAPAVLHASSTDPGALALATTATGGRVFAAADVRGLIDAMREAHPPRRIVRPAHPMRSPWWMVPFAGLLCAEWAVRRKRGLP